MKETKYRNTREKGLNYLGSMLGGMSGSVVKEKHKRKKEVPKKKRKIGGY